MGIHTGSEVPLRSAAAKFRAYFVFSQQRGFSIYHMTPMASTLGKMIHTLNITIPSMSPGSLRPSGLAESPLLLIGLAERLFVDVELFKRVDDLSRCGMIRTIFTGSRTRVDGSETRYRLGSQV